jgi:deoxyribonuclease V
MLIATDVHYLSDDRARAAALVFHDWTSATAVAEYTEEVTGFAPYRPGEFFRRELPCLLAVLRRALAQHAVEIVIVDGYVDVAQGPGLGRYLRDALPQTAVVGVAKNRYVKAPAVEVIRGHARPLFVSAVGIDVDDAAQGVGRMHGPYRLPTLLVRTDHLARAIA